MRGNGKTPWRLIAAASAGNALEFYDVIVFGYFIRQIGDAFFPAADPKAAVLAAWAIFGVAFIARPIGAIVLGSYADRAGRKAAMTLSILLMTLGTALLAFMPRHDSIGALAPCGLLAARLLQGFSAGGEFGGATAFMLEHGARGRRGFIASFQFTSQAISNVTASVMGLAVTTFMTKPEIASWGFRLPFMFGLLIGPVGLYLRNHLAETPAFLAAVKLPEPARALFARGKWRLALAAGLIAVGTVGTYVNNYLPSYAVSELHLPDNTGFIVTLASAMLIVLITPLAAIWSDRVGRLVPAALGNAVMLVAAIPLLSWVVASPSLERLLWATLVLTAARAVHGAVLGALLAEMFPVEIRGVGMSVGYTLGVAIFGGPTGFVCSEAVRISGNAAAPGYVIAGAAVITLGALWGIGRLRLGKEGLLF